MDSQDVIIGHEIPFTQGCVSSASVIVATVLGDVRYMDQS